MGLALLANLAACDFGYLSVGGLLRRTQDALATMQRLERHRGHFYNWYETRTLQPLPAALCFQCGQRQPGRPSADPGLRPAGTGRGPHPQPHRSSPVCATPWAFSRISTATTPCAGPARRRTGRRRPPACAPRFDVAATARSTRRTRHSPPRWPPKRSAFKTWAANPAADIARSIWRICFSSRRGWRCRPPPMMTRPRCFNDKLAARRPTTVPRPRRRPGRSAMLARLDQARTLREVAEFGQPGCPLLTAAGRLEPGRRAHAGFAALPARGQRPRPPAPARSGNPGPGKATNWPRWISPFCSIRRGTLFSIGFNVTERRRDTSFYDLLASEARLCSYVAIALGQVPQDHWFSLGRLLVASRGRAGPGFVERLDVRIPDAAAGHAQL